MEAEGINPLDPSQGVWFVVSRTGTKRSVVDTTNIEVESVIGEVEVNGVKQKMNLKRTVLAPLTEEECEKAGKDCEDLTTLGGAALTYEQIEALINGTAAPDADDEPSSSAEADAEMARQAAKLEADKAAARAAADKAASTPAPAPATDVKQVDAATKAAQNEAIQKRLAEIAARKAAAEKKAAEEAAAKKAAEEAAAAAEPAQDDADALADMSDEDFAKKFGPGAGA